MTLPHPDGLSHPLAQCIHLVDVIHACVTQQLSRSSDWLPQQHRAGVPVTPIRFTNDSSAQEEGAVGDLDLQREAPGSASFKRKAACFQPKERNKTD